jgi:hypothetical protein
MEKHSQLPITTQ